MPLFIYSLTVFLAATPAVPGPMTATSPPAATCGGSWVEAERAGAGARRGAGAGVGPTDDTRSKLMGGGERGETAADGETKGVDEVDPARERETNSSSDISNERARENKLAQERTRTNRKKKKKKNRKMD